MKTTIIILALLISFSSCAIRQVSLGMSEEQFKKEHPRSRVVEMSRIRTVYHEKPMTFKDTTDKFFYFSNHQLVLMDEGIVVNEAGTREPTPLQ
jgi:hypothetical protein